MILVTPCGVMDTTNFGKSEVNRQTIDFFLKFQKKEKVEAKAEKEEANKDNSDSTNTDTNKKDKLLDIST